MPLGSGQVTGETCFGKEGVPVFLVQELTLGYILAAFKRNMAMK